MEEARHVKTVYMRPSWVLMQLTFFWKAKQTALSQYKNGEYVDYDIDEALSMTKTLPEYQRNIVRALSYNYTK